MRSIQTKGIICIRDDLDFEYQVSYIEYTEWEDETYCYLFRPDYSVIDLLPDSVFQGIPGLNLDLRKPEYVRKNMVPTFISERTPGPNREDLWELLERYGMDHLNRLEWLIRTDMRYCGDPLYVKRYEEKEPDFIIDLSKLEQTESRSVNIQRKMLESICSGAMIDMQNYRIDDSNRLQYYTLLMMLYRKEKSYLESRKKAGIQRAAKEGKYKGRRPVQIPEPEWLEVAAKFRSKKITEEQALKRLGISRSTFYRRLKKES